MRLDVPAENGRGYGEFVESFTDDELTEAALAADPDEPIPNDAVPFGQSDHGGALLPEWYMPTPQRVDRRPRVVLAVGGIVLGLLVVNGAGLCVTYGWPEIAW